MGTERGWVREEQKRFRVKITEKDILLNGAGHIRGKLKETWQEVSKLQKEMEEKEKSRESMCQTS